MDFYNKNGFYQNGQTYKLLKEDRELSKSLLWEAKT